MRFNSFLKLLALAVVVWIGASLASGCLPTTPTHECFTRPRIYHTADGRDLDPVIDFYYQTDPCPVNAID